MIDSMITFSMLLFIAPNMHCTLKYRAIIFVRFASHICQFLPDTINYKPYLGDSLVWGLLKLSSIILHSVSTNMLCSYSIQILTQYTYQLNSQSTRIKIERCQISFHLQSQFCLLLCLMKLTFLFPFCNTQSCFNSLEN